MYKTYTAYINRDSCIYLRVMLRFPKYLLGKLVIPGYSYAYKTGSLFYCGTNIKNIESYLKYSRTKYSQFLKLSHVKEEINDSMVKELHFRDRGEPYVYFNPILRFTIEFNNRYKLLQDIRNNKKINISDIISKYPLIFHGFYGPKSITGNAKGTEVKLDLNKKVKGMENSISKFLEYFEVGSSNFIEFQ